LDTRSGRDDPDRVGALPRPGVAPGPHRELVDALHALHHRAGWPSLRRLAAETGVSHTTVSKTFSSPALPSWGTLELLVEAMGGNVLRFHALWLAASTPAEQSGRAEVPIAGRAAELAVVRHHLETGTGLLLVVGEAGIGKTTLVAAAAARADACVVVGHCLRLSREVPLLPVIDALRVLLDADQGRWMAEALAECPTYVRRSLARLLPELEPDAPAPSDDPWGLERLMASVTSILRALATRRPLALHLEDCHWADRSTLDLLTHLASTSSPVPLVATSRSPGPDVTSEHADWLSMTRWIPGVATIDLGPLTLEETAEQLSLLSGAPADLEAAERIQARSQGLPLYTAQLARASSDSELPPHLAALLDRRFADLDGAAWRVARVLGLAQRRVGPALLRTVSGLDPDQTDAALRELARRGLLRTVSGDAAELAHPLFVDAVRRRLLPGEGARVHAGLAAALADEPGIEPAEVADHWQAAGRADLEVAHRVSAARRAGSRFAYREALDAWLRVLELWDAGERPEGVELWEVLAAALDAATEAGDFDAGRMLVRRARVLDLPDRERAVVLQRIGVFLIDDGDVDNGLPLLHEALALLEAMPPSPELGRLLGERVGVFLKAGRFDEAEADLRRGLAVLDTLQDRRSRRRWLAASVWLTWRAGDLDGAVAIARDALSAEWSDSDPIADIMVAANGTDVMLRTATPARQVEELAGDVLRRAEACHLTQSFAGVLLRGNVCWAYLQQGDVAAARELLRPVTGSDPDPNSAIAHILLGAVELREGRVRTALERCRAAEAHVHNHDPFWAEGVPWHAEVELCAGRTDAALDLLGEALDVALPTQALTTAPLVRLHARAHADRLDAVGASPSERHRVVEQLLDTVAGAVVDPFGPAAFDAAVPACSRSWRAELSRSDGTATVDAWASAAAEWDRITRPHDAAYCRWRAAQVAVREGRGSLAGQLLRRAGSDARTHVPLARAVAATARAA
jgi:Tfp pilus assembly protein PilF